MHTTNIKNGDIMYTYYTASDYLEAIDDLKDMQPKNTDIIQYFYGWALAGIDAVEPAGRFLDFLASIHEPGEKVAPGVAQSRKYTQSANKSKKKRG